MSQQLASLVATAFSNQRELNNVLNPKWVEQGWRYYRAIWREAAEVFDHTNWAWWSAATYDKPLTDEQKQQVHIELCDILHFGLSLDIVSYVQGGRDTSKRAEDYVDAFEMAKTYSGNLEDAVEGLMIDALLIREFNVKKFACACRAVGLSLTHLMCYYFAKTALNQFRWDNGYKLPKDDPKKYIKMWELPTRQKVEDNTVLIEVMEELVSAHDKDSLVEYIQSGAYGTNLYGRLGSLYSLIKR
jgi:hypothetical protein